MLKCTFDVLRENTACYERVVELCDAALDVSSSGQGDDYFTLTFFINDVEAVFRNAIGVADAQAGVVPAELNIEEIEDEDWEAITLNSFEPVQVGRFFIHRFDEEVPEGMIGLKVPAGMAFGSGEHDTTSGCLQLFEELVDAHKPIESVMDMGCGSGILGVAAAKVLNKPVLAIDIEEESVQVCTENAAENGVAEFVTAKCGDGFDTPEVSEQGPFDLIFGNLFMHPLVPMAPAMAAALKPGGVVITSGFFKTQACYIAEAYIAQGLELLKKHEHGDWATISFVKPAA